MNELIQVIQLPIIEEQLQSMKESVEAKTKEAMSLVCTEETLASVKATRSQLNKEFGELEELRKKVKASVLAPYEAFEAKYKECVTEAYKAADKNLKEKISQTETGIKVRCEEELREYFAECVSAHHVEWLTFDRMNMDINLTVARQKTYKAQKANIMAFVAEVSHCIESISTMDNADEILVEYKRSLSLSEAITIVSERNKRIEAERAMREQREEVVEAEQMAIERVESAAPEIIEPPVVVSAPVAEAAPADEKVYKLSFTCYGTKAQLKALKEFMGKEGIRYE